MGSHCACIFVCLYQQCCVGHSLPGWRQIMHTMNWSSDCNALAGWLYLPGWHYLSWL